MGSTALVCQTEVFLGSLSIERRQSRIRTHPLISFLRTCFQVSREHFRSVFSRTSEREEKADIATRLKDLHTHIHHLVESLKTYINDRSKPLDAEIYSRRPVCHAVHGRAGFSRRRTRIGWVRRIYRTRCGNAERHRP